MEVKSEIKEEWLGYYETLEVIRRMGVVNMFAAAPYLAAYEEIDYRLASDVLSNWMRNYAALSDRLGWRR